MKLLQTKDYLLLIDEEAEIKDGDICIDSTGVIFKHENHFPISIGQRKITAYHPLTKEAKELDLPLLPNPFEVDKSVELANNYVNKEYKDYGFKDLLVDIFLEGYKAAQQSNKQFSLEDVENILIKYLEEGFISKEQGYINPKAFLQSLSTQQLPKEFIPEYYTNGDMIVKNRNGVRELVGTYKY